MSFPKYKANGLVGIFNIRIRRFAYLDKPKELLITWGRSAAYNNLRISRIANLPLISSEISPWRQYILHEVSYHETRIKTHSNRWQKAYERCYLALRKLENGRIGDSYTLWQMVAFSEATRLNLNYKRHSGSSKFYLSPEAWEDAYELNAWILRQKPPPVNPRINAWDLTFASINRDTFRRRRFKWDACAKRQEENLSGREFGLFEM